MKVLQIDSSILGEASISRQLTQAVVEQLQQKYAEAIQIYLYIYYTISKYSMSNHQSLISSSPIRT